MAPKQAASWHWPKDEYEYGFLMWTARNMFKETYMVPDLSLYKALVMEGEGEIADHACGPDCALCWRKNADTASDG